MGLVLKERAVAVASCGLMVCGHENSRRLARLESGQRRIDVVEFLDLADALGFDPVRAISALRKVT